MKAKRNTIIILIAIVLVFTVLIVVSANSKSGLHKVYSVVSAPVDMIREKISKFGTEISNKISYLKEYDEIKERIDTLEKEKQENENAILENQSLKEENEELRALLELKEYYTEYRIVTANLIAEDVTDWYNEFTVDVGTDDGIREGNPVITAAGLVGIVASAGKTSSKVMTIADEQNVIMARIQRSNELVRVRGVTTENYTYEMKLDRIATTADLYVGDVIITAESGSVFPKGIRIGVVSKISTVSGTETRYATVTPSVVLNKLSEVTILADKTED